MEQTDKRLLGFARTMRTVNAGAEKKLWYAVRNRRFFGYKFKRQAVIGPYIVDFLCSEYNLVVELDGGQHDGQYRYDEKRTLVLQTQGFRVIRFANDYVLNNMDGVLTELKMALEETTLTPTLSRQRERGQAGAL